MLRQRQDCPKVVCSYSISSVVFVPVPLVAARVPCPARGGRLALWFLCPVCFAVFGKSIKLDSFFCGNSRVQNACWQGFVPGAFKKGGKNREKPLRIKKRVVALRPASGADAMSAEGALGAPRSYSFVSVAVPQKEKNIFFEKACRIKKRAYICTRLDKDRAKNKDWGSSLIYCRDNAPCSRCRGCGAEKETEMTGRE